MARQKKSTEKVSPYNTLEHIRVENDITRYLLSNDYYVINNTYHDAEKLLMCLDDNNEVGFLTARDPSDPNNYFPDDLSRETNAKNWSILKNFRYKLGQCTDPAALRARTRPDRAAFKLGHGPSEPCFYFDVKTGSSFCANFELHPLVYAASDRFGAPTLYAYSNPSDPHNKVYCGCWASDLRKGATEIVLTLSWLAKLTPEQRRWIQDELVLPSLELFGLRRDQVTFQATAGKMSGDPFIRFPHSYLQQFPSPEQAIADFTKKRHDLAMVSRDDIMWVFDQIGNPKGSPNGGNFNGG